MLVRVKLERNPHAGQIATTLDANGQFVSKELVDPEKAKAYSIIDGEPYLMLHKKVQADQEYERPRYSAEQHKQYLEALTSKEGLRLVNKLKNTRLIKCGQAHKILTVAGVEKKLIKKILDILYPTTPVRRLLNYRLEEIEFNRLPFKDLGINKEEIMQIFINNGLVYGKI